MANKNICVSWSGGKDAAYTLYQLQKVPGYAVRHLLVTAYEGSHKSAMHLLDSQLIEAQARSLGLHLQKMLVPALASNAVYLQAWQHTIASMRNMGIKSLAFGDIFLEDLKAWRESNLSAWEMEALFPLWGMDSRQLAQDMVRLGFESVVVCVDTRVLSPDFCGRLFDAAFINDLPKGVDPCGENGEFHTFCFNGPMFRKPVCFSEGERFQLPLQDPKHPDKEVYFQYLSLLPC